MNSAIEGETANPVDPRIPLVFGIGMGVLVLYLVTYAINLHAENDWYKEAWPAYRLLIHGHVLGFLHRSPAYVGSLILRAPFALLASVFGASARTAYIVCALPCLLAPGALAGYLAVQRTWRPRSGSSRRAHDNLRPVDLFMVTPCAVVALNGGHPEDILVAVLCVFAVLLAQRGSGKSAAFLLGIAVINKSWAAVIVPFVFAVVPPGRRLSSFVTFVLTAGIVLVPLTAIRATSSGGAGSALGDQTTGIFLLPQLLWWLGRTSWFVREAHVLLVVVDWLVTGAWWWLRVQRRPRPPRLDEILLALGLLFFLRAALDPWDNIYYLTPFLLTIFVYEDPPGFPKLSWLYAILIVVIVPPAGVLRPLGRTAHAAVFSAFAVVTIAWLGWEAFARTRSEHRELYKIANGAGTGAATRV